MSVTRRRFLVGAAAVGLGPFGCSSTIPPGLSESQPFLLGVASGDPTSDGVVLWTRVANTPFPTDQNLGKVEVFWQIALDKQMRHAVRQGLSTATPDSSHCVHVEVDQLEPDTEYFYRFEALNATSTVGRTHTLPSPGSHVEKYSIAVVSCQDYSTGYFTAYRDIVEKRPDLIIHLGDYIYETPAGNVRPYPVEEAMTLNDYRALYAQFRMDPDLRDAHAKIPWIVIWDDHEVVNDWGPDHYLPSSHNEKISASEYQVRKAAAIKAYMEYMPIRQSRKDLSGRTRIYDRTVIGDLLELNRLDVRSYRDTPVCDLDDHRFFQPCDEAFSPGRSLLGEEQEEWLLSGLGNSGAKWNCIVQATVMAPFDRDASDTVRYEADSWDNYGATRNRIVDAIVQNDVSNVVSLGANIHAFYAGVVYDRQDSPNRKVVLTEVVATSISAGGGGDERFNDIHGRLDQNPGIRFFENRFRGYVWVEVNHNAIDATFRAIDDIIEPDGETSSLMKLRIPSGTPTVYRIDEQ